MCLIWLFVGLKFARRHCYTYIQEAGETIFVPSGWHHTVENLQDTLSINHNWLNRNNLKWGEAKICNELKQLLKANRLVTSGTTVTFDTNSRIVNEFREFLVSAT